MPIEYQVLEGGSLVKTVFSGHVTTQELIDHTREFVADTAIKPGHCELADLSPAKTTEVSFTTLADAVDLETGAEILKGARLAILAPTAIQYGMSRMYLALAAQTPRAEVKIFRDREQAESWLDFSADPE
jgi:hypothetical protein